MLDRDRYKQRPRVCRPAFAILVAMAAPSFAADGGGGARGESPWTALELPEVTVVGTTPLSILGLPLSKVPGNVQSAEDEDIRRHEALDLANFLNRGLSGIHINDVQNNPFQPDLTYRGFSASPLVGTPIGLSVYQDGVRVNEPFGDTVNWDLIPRAAIANIDLMPGSNPLFGLNTLGGALSVRTKSGFSHPGTRGEAYGGSFERRGFELEHGGSQDRFDWFFTANLFNDQGWRPSSGSSVRQVFGKFGFEDDTTDIDLSYTFADNRLNGVGPTPESRLKVDRRAVYTVPDITENALHFVSLKASREPAPDWVLTANAYYRGNSIDTFNSDIGLDCEAFFDLSQCLDPAGNLLPAARNNTSRTVEHGTGAAFQIGYLGARFQRDNQLTLGGSLDYAHTRFTQSEQAAAFTEGRGTVAAGELTEATRVIARNDYIGAFVTDTFSLTPWLSLSAAARWNRAQIRLADQLGTALNGTHAFDRINPAGGFTIDPFKALSLATPVRELTLYGSYNEGFRVPTPVELTCADPKAPCSLPSNFIADPPLEPVVAKTREVGVRGKLSEMLRFSLAAYRTELSNDILFVTVPGGLLSHGFFRNVGETRREGLELGLKGKHGRLDWYANYGFVDATYQTGVTLQNAVGAQAVRPGDRIPGIPEHRLNVGVEYELFPGWFFGGDLQYASSQFVRGDDSNELPAVPEYVLINLNARYEITKHVEIFALANNVLDQDYETFGVLNRNFFTGENERFLGPGAPIAGWAGLRVRLD